MKPRIRSTTAILVLILLIGLSLLLYPSVSNYWNSFHQTRAISTYVETVAHIDNDEYKQLLNEARQYNQDLAATGIKWNMSMDQRSRYLSLLSFDGNGLIGYLEISKLKVMLPMYHGTSDNVLQLGVGHLEGTSLPVGGYGSHCVLSGHRGLPSAKLLSDLNKLVVGDTFTLNVLDEVLTYEVDQIRVVLPADLKDLEIVPEMDYCTLVTCTPYGINTHRLLVRGHRTSNLPGDIRVTADALQVNEKLVALAIAVPFLIILALYRMIFPGRPAPTKRKRM